MELAVYNINGNKTDKKVKLDDGVFGVKPKDHAIYLDVRQHLANARQGTHKAKERGEIKGSTRKIKRQKGTGTARAGSIKSPIFRGGGRAFGPRPRDYSFKLNKGLKKLARLSALSLKAKENNIVVLEKFDFEAPKTKEFISFLNGLDLQGKKVTIMVASYNDNVFLAARNIPNIYVVEATSASTYDLLDCEVLLVEKAGLALLNEQLMVKS
jgi:large subunit ribosomal protein L4